MKSNKEILISFYNGKADNISRGTKLEMVPLYDILFKNGGLSGIDRNLPKGHSGSIFAYVQNELGLNDDRTNFSDGIAFIDIDKISRTDIKKIYDNFELISEKLPNTLCCWFSSSYYNQERDYGGLHFVLRVSNDETPYEEYKYFVGLYGMLLARVVYLTTGIDIRPNDGAGLDKVTKSLAQRFFLNYSEVKWNDNAYAIDPQLDEVTKEELKKWVNEFSNWATKVSDYKVVECRVSDYDLTPNGIKTAFGYADRITLLNTLANIGVDHDERVKFMLSICDGTGFKNGLTAFKENIIQCSRTAEHQKVDNAIIARGIRMLKKLGYNIEAEIITNYQPIDYKFDSIFEEVYNEHKDDPYYNVHTNPRNLLRINLKSDEYLKHYKDSIMDIIYQYELTYLIADCMTGKTTLALDVTRENVLFDNDDNFIIHVSGDAVDICVPYNSVADNKAKESRKDIKRVVTADISKFSLEKRNVFIWNTIMPLYEEYFKNGLVKRSVIFFDESQKIVTDDYRWETVFEMFKALPMMYKHFVFMTGTPAGELEYLKEFFSDFAVIKVEKEIDYKRECKFLKYNKFGFGDRISLIEECINNGRLPLIYSNSQKSEWVEAIKRINKDRISQELKPYRVLEYSSTNKEQLDIVNKTNSIKGYDIVIATKYCSVGIDFMKDDKRMRCSIIDYANEHDCTFHDIWQFTLRNRNQDTITKIIVREGEEYYNKLYNYWWYKELFDDMAKLHTHKITEDDFMEMHEDDEIETKNFNFINDVFLTRQFGRLVNDKNRYFNDPRNIKLLSSYYLYRKVFSNVRVIKNMLERRGVEVSEIDMTHRKVHNDSNVNKEIYRFFVDNFDEIGNIHSSKGQHDSISYLIDINSDETEYIKDNKIYSRNVKYLNWLIKQFAGKKEWYKILCEREYMSKDIFIEFNRMRTIAKRITKREINKIKKYKDYMMEYGMDEIITDMVYKHYGKVMDIKKDDVRTAVLLRDVIESYRKILEFAVDNIEFIEEIKNAEEDGWIDAVHKMDIAMRQKEQEKTNKKIGNAMKKKIIIVWEDGEEEVFGSRDELAEKIGVSKGQLSNILNGKRKHKGRQFTVKNA